jgi:hypothetical protein
MHFRGNLLLAGKTRGRLPVIQPQVQRNIQGAVAVFPAPICRNDLEQVLAFVGKGLVIFITQLQAEVELFFQLLFKLAQAQGFIYGVFHQHVRRKTGFLQRVKGIAQGVMHIHSNIAAEQPLKLQLQQGNGH